MASRVPSTMADSDAQPRGSRPEPGILVLFSRGQPRYHPLVLPRGRTMALGRNDVGGLDLGDEKMSTRHAELHWDGRFRVTDLGSRNGTFLDGARIDNALTTGAVGVLRVGHTLVLLLDDVTGFTATRVLIEHDAVVGPRMRAVLAQVALARRQGAHVLVRGESGAGKELVARAFHRAASPAGPLVVFNCANIQPGLAEARLFGTARGAFPDARDTAGLFLQADGGVLFLDEIAELEAPVQAKLLRVVETGEVQRVGDSAVKRVRVCLAAASHQALPDRVRQGLFRRDLLFRLNRFEVQVPALRERREEIPWLMQHALAGRPVTLHVSLVEAALLRPWPGNVRELVGATVAAGARAEAEDGVVRLAHLDPRAGLPDEAAVPPPEVLPQRPRTRPGDVSRDEVVAALEESGGNATLAAKKLGLHRTQLNRLRARYGLTGPAGREP